MNSEFIFRVIFFTVLVLLTVVRVTYGLKARRTGKGGWAVEEEAIEREGWGIMLLRIAALPFILAAIVLYGVNPPWLSAFAIPFPAWARWIGVGLAVMSIPLLVWVHHTLGKHWSTSVQLQEGHTLVTSGPYRWVRHPIYSSGLLFAVAIWLVTANGVVGLCWAGTLILYGYRSPREEAMLAAEFGEAYRGSAGRTGAVLPRLWL